MSSNSIDIFRVLDIILAKKWMIVGVVILCTSATFFFNSLQEEKRVLRTILEIGRYQVSERAGFQGLFWAGQLEYQPLEDYGEARSRYRAWTQVLANREKYEDLEINAENDLDFEYMSDIMVQPRLTLPRSNLAKGFMRELNRRVLQDHERLLTAQQQGIDNLREQVNLRNTGTVERDKHDLGPSRNTTKSLRTTPDSMRKKKFGDKAARRKGSVNASKTLQSFSEVLRVKQKRIKHNVVKSRIIEPPVFGRRIVAPRPVRNSVLAAVIFCVAALFGVFLHYLWSEYRVRYTSSERDA